MSILTANQKNKRFATSNPSNDNTKPDNRITLVNCYNKIKKHWKTAIFLLFFILAVATQEVLFAVLTVIALIWIVGTEVKDGVKVHGWKHEVIDTIINIVLVLIFWFGLQLVLNTGTPISGIVTCSMLPNLERGDLVIIQGTKINGYELEMSKEEFEKIKSYEAIVEYKNISFAVNGSIYSYCAYSTHSINPDPVCNYFIAEPEEFKEKRGGMTFHYSKCQIKYLDEGTVTTEPCITSVGYGGVDYKINLSNDVLVYIPDKGTYFSYIGDIIHRTYFKINVEEETYYLTKGDNNQILDIQMYEYNHNLGNLPAKEIHGKQILRIPYLGYLKLYISGFLTAPEQCNTNLIYDYLT